MLDTAKLPKWAQQHIEKIERERDTAIRTLNESLDKQTKSAFYFDDQVCTGERTGPSLKRVYVQTYKMNVEHEGIVLQVMTRQGERGIDISWEETKRGMSDVALVPVSFNKIMIVSKENMRA